jgi:hypothetical protein
MLPLEKPGRKLKGNIEVDLKEKICGLDSPISAIVSRIGRGVYDL